MRTHIVKITLDAADWVITGEKNFEIRENDRLYQRGDFVRFVAVNKDGSKISHLINELEYEITFVISSYGLKEGYVVFGIKEGKQEVNEVGV